MIGRHVRNTEGEVDAGAFARTRNIKDKVVASDEQLRRAPKGDLNHGIWKGDCLKPYVSSGPANRTSPS